MLLFRLPLFHSPFLYVIFNVGKCEIGYNSKNKEEYEGNKKSDENCTWELIKVIIFK